MSFSFESLLGSELQGSDKAPHPVSSLLGDKQVVGLYFSAHWCGPCRHFTPVLAKSYTAIKAAGKSFEIVFVSSDKDESAFADYFGEMPWVALPFAQRDIKNKLSKKFKVQGIPTLVLLDAAGNVISSDGRSVISEDPAGDQFPWPQPSFADAMGKAFVRPDGSEVTREALVGKTVGLYFSAHWCPPCRGFTPKFVEAYNNVQKLHPGQFEVVFVSSDRDEDSFQEYHKEMPWLALPYSDRKGKDALSKLFEVEGIPSLVILQFDSGKILNANGRSAVMGDIEGVHFPWLPQPVNDLAAPEGINETPSVVVMAASADKDTQAQIENDLTAVAKRVRAADGENDPSLLFFIDKSSSNVAQQVQGLTKTDASKGVVLLLVDIQDNAYYVDDAAGPVTAARVEEFISKFHSKSLKGSPIRG